MNRRASIREAAPYGVATEASAPAAGEDFYRRLIDGMRCGILVIERTGRVVMVNDHARAILELPEPPLRGAAIAEVLADHPQLAQILHDAFSMSLLPNRAEIDLKSRSESGKTIGFTISLVPGPGGAPTGAALFFKDLTHVEHKEEQERLKDRLAALGQMAANLAHEIRNPLASIEVSTSLLKRRLPDSAGERELLDKIIAEVRRLNRTITSSLEFVRPVSLTLAPASIRAVLDDALTVALGRRGRPGIRIERTESRELPDFLMDRGQLRQVFENLFLNAMEAMGETGVLGIDVGTIPAPASGTTPYRPAGARDARSAFDAYAVVRVSDTGCGVPADHLDKLFYPFFTTKTHGSGVGLSMAKKIVDSHRGVIDVASRPGAGTVFTVRLPMTAWASVETPA
ncbi:MAG TPA: ATP-binding protein [Candidatus Polarisedimenticolaceae bacterium]|nr:ATP-binding protein [Candidatus Polarisedimenticolaceae bacterium]